MIKIKSKIDTDNHTYSIGDSHHFAIALNRLTGAPLVSFCKEYLVREDERVADDDLYWSEHPHAAVLVSDTLVVDCYGLREISEGDLYFAGCDFSDDPPSALKMKNYGSSEEDLASNYADYNEDIIQQAMSDAKRWGCDAIVSKALNANRRKSRECDHELGC